MPILSAQLQARPNWQVLWKNSISNRQKNLKIILCCLARIVEKQKKTLRKQRNFTELVQNYPTTWQTEEEIWGYILTTQITQAVHWIFSLGYFKLRLPGQAWNKNWCVYAYIYPYRLSHQVRVICLHLQWSYLSAKSPSAFPWFQKDKQWSIRSQCHFFHYFLGEDLSSLQHPISPCDTEREGQHHERCPFVIGPLMCFCLAHLCVRHDC